MSIMTDSGASIWIVAASPLLQVRCYGKLWVNLGLITARLKWLNIDLCMLCSAACWLCQRAAILSGYNICIVHIYGLNIFYCAVGNMAAALFSLLFRNESTPASHWIGKMYWLRGKEQISQSRGSNSVHQGIKFFVQVLKMTFLLKFKLSIGLRKSWDWGSTMSQ